MVKSMAIIFKRLEWTFLQRRYADGQQAHERVLLNVIIIRETQIKTIMNTTPVRTAVIKNPHKTPKVTSVGENGGKLELSCTFGGHVKWCSHCEKQCGRSLKN